MWFYTDFRVVQLYVLQPKLFVGSTACTEVHAETLSLLFIPKFS